MISIQKSGLLIGFTKEIDNSGNIIYLLNN